VPQAGTYTITHPYGVETVNVTTPGRRAINITRDIGIGRTGQLCALNGNIGPFLRGVGGPYTEVNPDTGATETFVGDPNTTEAVTGSPQQHQLRAHPRPGRTIQTNVFTVSGKVLDQRAQTPVTWSATYSRNVTGTSVEVFAKAPNRPACMRNGLALVGTPPRPASSTCARQQRAVLQQLSQAAPPRWWWSPPAAVPAPPSRPPCRASSATWCGSPTPATTGQQAPADRGPLQRRGGGA
jgi:hypothetical protein